MNDETKKPAEADEMKQSSEGRQPDGKDTKSEEQLPAKDPFRVRPLHADNDESGGH